MEHPILECRDIWKIFNEGEPGEVQAIKGVSFKLKKGKMLGIVGPSGSGKSTLLNILGCLDRPTRGKYLINGRDVSGFSRKRLAMVRRNEIGFVFQSFNLIGTMTALENVMFPMVFSGRGGEKRAGSLLEAVGLGKRMNHTPAKMSGGERQRVSIARALANDPDIILADEPTGNLDTKTGREIMNVFTRLNEEEGKTIIIITHDLNILETKNGILRIIDGEITDVKK